MFLDGPLTYFRYLVQNSEGNSYGDSGDSCADPPQEFTKGFLGVSSDLPLFIVF
jgi:hypothetical protein